MRTRTTDEAPASPQGVMDGLPVPFARSTRFGDRHPFGMFVLLSYAISWPLFIAATLTGAEILVVVGAFGPAAAAVMMVRRSGQSHRQWWRDRWRWRQPLRLYLYALGLPVAIVALTAAEVVLIGERVDVGPLATLVPRHVVTVLVVALLGGGQEEPGWRGFALERLQARHSPLTATLALGLVWGAWHLPVYGIGGFAGPVLLVVFYTWLYNRTHSLPLCVLLHASFNTSLGYLDLANAGTTTTAVFLVTAAACAATLIALTRGRLGTDCQSQLGSCVEAAGAMNGRTSDIERHVVRGRSTVAAWGRRRPRER